MRISLIVAAGGKGTRFCPPKRVHLASDISSLSKVFFPFHDRTVLETALSNFPDVRKIGEWVLVVPSASRKWVTQIVKRHGWKRVKIVPGGSTRAESVLCGLRACDPRSDWVMVHDGARPLIRKESIRALIAAAGKADAIILGKPVVPTIKKTSADGIIVETVDRSRLFEAETPQLMRRTVLTQAYQDNPEALKATDEASLLESMGHRVRVLANPHWNPKITTFQDLEMAIKQTKVFETRSGLGQDLHRLEAGRPFILGGVKIPSLKGPVGHSDGDVLLHAVADAVLGGIAKGDIGEWFSDKKSKWKGMDSRKILSFCVEEARKAGWRVSHLDCVVHLEKPKLGLWKQKIKTSLAALLKQTEDRVSIKAKTGEGLGDVGKELAVRADALVTLERISS